MAVRFQAPPQPGRPLLDAHLRQFSMPPTMHSLPSMQHSLGALNSLSLPQYPLAGLKPRPAPAPAPRQFSLPTMPGNPVGLNGLLSGASPKSQNLLSQVDCNFDDVC